MKYRLRIAYEFHNPDGSITLKGGICDCGTTKEEANEFVKTVREFIGEEKLKANNYVFEPVIEGDE